MALPSLDKILQQLNGGKTSSAQKPGFPVQDPNAIRLNTAAISPTANTTPQTTSIGTGDVVKAFGQGIARGYVAAGQGIYNVPGMTKELVTTGKVTDKSDKPFIVADDNSVFSKVVQKLTGTKEAISLRSEGESFPGVKEGSPFAIPIAGLSSVLDLAGGGGLKGLAGLSKALKVTEDFAEAGKLMRTAGFSDNIVKEFAPEFARLKDEKKITEMLLDLEKRQNTSAPKIGKDIVPPSLPSRVIDEVAPAADGAVERRFITRSKEVLPDATKIEGQYIPRSTDELAIKARNQVIDDIATAEKIALNNIDDTAVATASELLKHYARQAAKASDLAVKNAIYDKAAEVANTVAKKLTEQGRSIQAASILTRLTPEGQVRFAAREIQKWNELNPTKKVPELTGDQAGKIINDMKQIESMDDTIERSIKFKKLQDDISNLVPSPWWKKLVTVWKAGLLTGIKTSGLNIFSNAFHGISEVVKDVPAVAVDTMASLFTGQRTKTLTTRGVPAGLKEGAQKGWRYLKTGFDERDIASKLDYKPVNFSNKAVQGYVDTVFRVLGTEDQPFYYGALKRSLADQALAQGKNQGLKGKELTEFVTKSIDSPTDAMQTYALLDAETAVFQNKTALGGIAKHIQQIPGAEFVLPFGRTPSSVAMQIINYSPAGFIKTIAENIGKGKFDQRLFSQGMGRAATGTGVLYLGSELYNRGMIALDNPKTERERELWKLEGKKPNSIKVGDEWRSVQTLGPVGPVLLIGGHFKQSFNENGSPTKAIIDATFGTLKSFTEQTFLRGVDSVLSAITDPERNAKSAVSNFISSFVPTIISDVARAKDPKERRAETVLERIQTRIPLLREKLEPQVTVLGEEKERIGNPLEVMADPTRPSKEIKTPVIEELRRLTDEGFAVSPTLLGDKTGYAGLSRKQNTELWKRAGAITDGKLENLFKSQKYRNLDDDEKAKIVETFIEKSKNSARAELVLTLTQGLEGEALKNKLSELKQNKLMTRDVFNLYQDLR